MYVDYGNTILTTAIIVILVTVTIGAISIMSLGPKWLKKESFENENNKVWLAEFSNILI